MKTASEQLKELIESERDRVEKEFPSAGIVMVFAQATLTPQKGRKDSGGNNAINQQRISEGRCVIRSGSHLVDRTAGSVAGAIHAAIKDLRALARGTVPTSGKFGESARKTLSEVEI